MAKAEVGRQPNLRDDPLGDCRSFGSYCRPSSQSRKISIGVQVASPANGRSRGTKELKSTVANAEVVCSLENSMQRNWKEKDTSAFGTDVKSKLSEALQQLSSPRISTRSLKRNAPLMEAVSGAEQVFHYPTSCGRQNKGHGLMEPAATYSACLFANQGSVIKSGNSKAKNFNEASYQMEGRRDRTNGQLHEFAFANMAEVRSEATVIEDQANKSENRTETLKMKLWEILGTVSVANDEHSKCRNHEQDANHLITEQVFVQKHDRAVQFRQNSNTTKTDSEGPGQTLKRPTVRSITRKRSHTSVHALSTRSKTPSCNKGKHQEGNIFVFDGWHEGTHAATNGASSMCTRKKSGERSFKFQPRKISFPPKEDRMETFPESTGIKEEPVQGYHTSPSNNANETDEQKQLNQLTEHIHSSRDCHQQGEIDNPFLKKDVDPQSHIESPTFRVKSHVCSSPSSSTPKADKIVDESSSPCSAREMFSTRNICSFRKLCTSEEDCDRSNIKPHFSDNDEETEQSPPGKAATGLADGESDCELSDSSSEYASYDSSAAGVITSQRDTLSPEIGAIKKFKSMLRPTKRARNLENHEFDFNGPRENRQTYKRAEPGESSWAEEILVSNEDDGLARAAKLFLSELGKLKSKISSISIEKSSEILLSVAESIHLQFQNVESQIQKDMVKMLNVGKSRRKFLETNFEEKQQQLKNINQKFKEEVNRHFQDCMNSLQELEAQQIEFKGTMERQKASHRNNLLQVEEAVDMQLTDAQRKIEAIHELGRGKILQLKQLIAMCLK